MSDAGALELAKTNFTALDWAIVAVYLALSLVIGVAVKRYATSMTAYIGAGRALGTWLGVATMTGTEMGLVTVMYSAEKGFKGGFAAFHIALISGLVTLAVGLTGFIVAPLRRRRVLTIPEFYEQRYGRGVRVLGGAILTLGGVLNMGLFLKVGAMFLVGVTGLSQHGWAVPLVMTTLLALVLAYTVLGGMISVVITDYIQFVLLSFGLVLATILAVERLGWSEIFDTVAAHMGPAGFDPLASEGQFGPAYVLWMVMLGLVNCALWPTAVARALAMESPQAVKRQYTWSSLSFTIRFLIPYFWGICALVYIVSCEPQLQALFPTNAAEFDAMGDPANPLHKPLSPLYAMPVFLGRLLPAGVLGIIAAAMIAAFMSTHDSYLLVWSSVITQDIVAPLRRGRLSSRSRILLTRVLIVLIGLYIWAWGLFYTGSDDIWDYMAITGAVYFTGAFALLVGGLYWRRASRAGAYAALLAGCFAVFGLGPLRHRLPDWIRAAALLPSHAAPGWSAWISPWLPAAPPTSAQVGLASVALTVAAFVLGSLVRPDRTPAAVAPSKEPCP